MNAVLETAKAVNSPVIIQFSNGGAIFYAGKSLSNTDQRAAIAKFISKAGYQPPVVWVQTEPIEARRRATSSRKKGTVISIEDFEEAYAHFQPPTAAERPVVISGKHTYGTQARSVLKRIAGIAPDKPTPEAPKVQRGGRNIIVR